MKFSAAVLALAAGANAFKNVTYTTEIVTAITTYCPEPTTVEYGGTTYTITEVRIRLFFFLDRLGRGGRRVWESSAMSDSPMTFILSRNPVHHVKTQLTFWNRPPP